MPQELHRTLRHANRVKPLLSLSVQVMLGATIGIARPAAVTWLNSDLFTIFLGFLMLSMGLTLTVDDFKKARAHAMTPSETPTQTAFLRMS